MIKEKAIKEKIERQYGNVRAFAQEIDVPYTTVRALLEKGFLNTRVQNVLAIAKGLNMSIEEFQNEMQVKTTLIDEAINVMRELSEERQNNVLDYAKIQLKEQQNTISDNVVDIQEYLYPVTTINVAKGGKGYFYGDNDNNIRYTNKLLNAYDFALDVVGDSMSDKINEGDVVCVRKDYDFTNGAIYVVDVDGESLIKKVYDSFDSLMLRSINKFYDDIVVQKSENVRIIGAVVDWFTPVK